MIKWITAPSFEWTSFGVHNVALSLSMYEMYTRGCPENVASATEVAGVVEWVHQPTEGVVREIRRQVRAVLADWDLDSNRIDDAVLVIEELVANAVDHAQTDFRLVLRLTGALLRVTVSDGCLHLPEPRPRNPTAQRGRGLHLVDSLSQRWGWSATSHGKTVWAVVPMFELPGQRG